MHNRCFSRLVALVMNKGAMEQIVMVVPDSGTDQLAGLAGKMTITIENGVHNYRLDYTLP